jgi:hypothetical protein
MHWIVLFLITCLLFYISLQVVMHLFGVNFGDEGNPWFNTNYRPVHKVHVLLFIVIWFGSVFWIFNIFVSLFPI